MGKASDAVGGSVDPDMEDWVRSFRPLEESSSPELPPHHPNCLGCGPTNPHGHYLSVRRCRDGVVAHHLFEPTSRRGAQDSTRRRGGDRNRRSFRFPALHGRRTRRDAPSRTRLPRAGSACHALHPARRYTVSRWPEIESRGQDRGYRGSIGHHGDRPVHPGRRRTFPAVTGEY